jgi:hypothetical protein
VFIGLIFPVIKLLKNAIAEEFQFRLKLIRAPKRWNYKSQKKACAIAVQGIISGIKLE